MTFRDPSDLAHAALSMHLLDLGYACTRAAAFARADELIVHVRVIPHTIRDGNGPARPYPILRVIDPTTGTERQREGRPMTICELITEQCQPVATVATVA